MGNDNQSKHDCPDSLPQICSEGWMRLRHLLNMSKKKIVALGNERRFFIVPDCWGASLVICSDWMIHAFMLTSRGLLQQLFIPAIRWVFPLLLRSNAPQCVLSTKTALSCLSAKRQKCCAANPAQCCVAFCCRAPVRPPADWLNQGQRSHKSGCLFPWLANKLRCKCS